MPWPDAAEPGAALFLLIPGLPIVLWGLAGLLALPVALGIELRAAARRRQGVPTLWDHWPSVSIIVTARNRAGVIDGCVRSIARTRYTRYEVILVDDGSTDSTAELMASFAAADLRIKVVRQRGGGPAAARNLGVRHASGDVLMFADADATFAPRTVDHMLQGFGDGRTGAVLGGGCPGERNPLRGGPLAAIRRLGGALTRALSAVGGLAFLPGGIEAYPSTVVAAVGPFRDGVADTQLELAWRVRSAGYRVASARRVRIQAASSPALREGWQQRTRRAGALLDTVTAGRGGAGTLWAGLLRRHWRLAPLVPVHTVLTAAFLLAALARQFRRPASRRGAKRAVPPEGSGAHRDGDAWRALREAWS